MELRALIVFDEVERRVEEGVKWRALIEFVEVEWRVEDREELSA